MMQWLQGLGRHSATGLSGTMALVLLVGANAAEAQTLPRDPGPFPPVRYEENDRALADPAKRTSFFDAVKYMPLGSDPSSYVSVGGEVRERYEHYTHEGFGLFGVRYEDYLLSRVLLHADVHLGDTVRAFVQFSREDAPHKVFSTPVDRNAGDLAQAFLDLSLHLLYAPLTIPLVYCHINHLQ
jgi:hypothetical protein